MSEQDNKKNNLSERSEIQDATKAFSKALKNLTKRIISPFGKENKNTQKDEARPVAITLDIKPEEIGREKATHVSKPLPPTPPDKKAMDDLSKFLNEYKEQSAQGKPHSVSPGKMPASVKTEYADHQESILSGVEKQGIKGSKPLSAPPATKTANPLSPERGTKENRDAIIDDISKFLSEHTESPAQSNSHSSPNKMQASVEIKYADQHNLTESASHTDNKPLSAPATKTAKPLPLTPPQQKALDEAKVTLNKDGMALQPDQNEIKHSSNSVSIGTHRNNARDSKKDHSH